jgi:hypothetical protein
VSEEIQYLQNGHHTGYSHKSSENSARLFLCVEELNAEVAVLIDL